MTEANNAPDATRRNVVLLAICHGLTGIGNTTMMVPGGIYSLLMFVTAALFLLPAVRGQNSPPSAQG